MDYISPSAHAGDSSSRRRPQDGDAASDRPLGNTAKSSTPPTEPVNSRLKRAQRYEGLAQARRLLYGYMQRVDPKRNAGDVYRTHDCRHVRIERSVKVNINGQTNVSHYGGLATCGSVWACPVCAAVIQQRRRSELSQLISWAYANGYSPCMVTFTFPHTSFDTLARLRECMRDAFHRLRRGGPWDRLRDYSGYDGLVRSTEVTYGPNGWHPHTHEIWLVRPMSEFDQAEFVDRLKVLWKRACIASGLLDANDLVKGWHFGLHAVDVRFSVKDSDYLAKQDSSRAWGADHELASSSSKAGRASGVHPHEFLIRRAKGDGARYLEYIHAMKGASQIYWSPGLKKRVGVADVQDVDIAEEDPTDPNRTWLLGQLNATQWDLVRKHRARAELLDVAESCDWSKVELFLCSLGWDPYS